MNLFIAITLAAFIMSAVPSSVMASTFNADTSIFHIADSQKDDPAHEKNGQCDDGCCISHCFCAGYAIPVTQTISTPVVHALAVIVDQNQKVDGTSASPQLRPPRILA
ncbi:MAG: hypothetical protein DI586_05270 [Micavibrio aeruginosavorus]|uniref:Uncharacterized protein n=1 Tax=Micavibrio aeruginosavorus TaxID=349221 RepID=A0A2W5FQ02_9BACT|nr:MAG: hypothetical protein DI586_05270 [Micavibrio aeruginosavorus]